jgi:hypothetical protein
MSIVWITMKLLNKGNFRQFGSSNILLSDRNNIKF